jgi:hypothetical protein
MSKSEEVTLTVTFFDEHESAWRSISRTIAIQVQEHQIRPCGDVESVGDVSGLVLSQEARPVPGALVRIGDALVHAGADGRFSIPQVEMPYAVELKAPKAQPDDPIDVTTTIYGCLTTTKPILLLQVSYPPIYTAADISGLSEGNNGGSEESFTSTYVSGTARAPFRSAFGVHSANFSVPYPLRETHESVDVVSHATVYSESGIGQVVNWVALEDLSVSAGLVDLGTIERKPVASVDVEIKTSKPTWANGSPYAIQSMQRGDRKRIDTTLPMIIESDSLVVPVAQVGYGKPYLKVAAGGFAPGCPSPLTQDRCRNYVSRTRIAEAAQIDFALPRVGDLLPARDTTVSKNPELFFDIDDEYVCRFYLGTTDTLNPREIYQIHSGPRVSLANLGIQLLGDREYILIPYCFRAGSLDSAASSGAFVRSFLDHGERDVISHSGFHIFKTE